jgi:hypothetical protein
MRRNRGLGSSGTLLDRRSVEPWSSADLTAWRCFRLPGLIALLNLVALPTWNARLSRIVVVSTRVFGNRPPLARRIRDAEVTNS